MEGGHGGGRGCRVGGHREASHAGSWYTDNGAELGRSLQRWMTDADSSTNDLTPRAIISPHAGYSYSGPTAGYVYKLIQPDKVKRVFILGPSHHHALDNCALTNQAFYDTPVGNLTIDEDVNKELMATGQFCRMGKMIDEAEHSIEMQLPYLAKVFEGHDVKIVPIMVGSLSQQAQQNYGKIMAPYLDNPENFFVISSDFCHWGKRFRFTFFDESKGEVFESIEWLDREGMRIIESKEPDTFHKYIKEYHNTICGRHPIAVLLNAVEQSKLDYNIRFVHYAQSSQCRDPRHDSSVSYAAAVVTTDPGASAPPKKRRQE